MSNFHQQIFVGKLSGYPYHIEVETISYHQARGEAKQIINSAQAYANETVLIAEGKAQRFNSIYEEYRKAKDITRDRIMLETMEKILPKVNKVISDEEVGKNFLPFLPINELQKAAKSP